MKQNTDNNNEKFTGAEIFVKCLEPLKLHRRRPKMTCL